MNNKDGLIIKQPFRFKKKVISRFKELYEEWLSWQNEVSQIKDKPYDKNGSLDVLADGEDMIQRHNALQAKTTTFLDNNLENHWFIKGLNRNGMDRIDLRLSYRVKHRISDLEEIKQSLPYAEPFWRAYIKKIFDRLLLLFDKLLNR